MVMNRLVGIGGGLYFILILLDIMIVGGECDLRNEYLNNMWSVGMMIKNDQKVFGVPKRLSKSE